MKATLKLEMFGDNIRQQFRLYSSEIDAAFGPGGGGAVLGKYPASCWVAEITGADQKYGLARKFMTGKKDYSQANGKGSRGIFVWYILESGKFYEVLEQKSWKSSERYFLMVNKCGEILKIDRSEVELWVKSRSGSMS